MREQAAGVAMGRVEDGGHLPRRALERVEAVRPVLVELVRRPVHFDEEPVVEHHRRICSEQRGQSCNATSGLHRASGMEIPDGACLLAAALPATTGFAQLNFWGLKLGA